MENEYMDYPERCDLKLVLDFVEANNKQDKNADVAQAALELETWLEKVEARITANI